MERCVKMGFAQDFGRKRMSEASSPTWRNAAAVEVVALSTDTNRLRMPLTTIVVKGILVRRFVSVA